MKTEAETSENGYTQFVLITLGAFADGVTKRSFWARYKSNTPITIERIKERAERINDTLPGLINWENDAILLLHDCSKIVDLDT